MQTVIHTINGTYLVPDSKQTDFIHWLEANAIKAGQQSIREQGNPSKETYTGNQLLSEVI